MTETILTAVLTFLSSLITGLVRERQDAANAQDVGRLAAERDAAVKAVEIKDAMAQADTDSHGGDVVGRLRDGTF